MRIQIPSANYVPDYNGGISNFPESWFTINEWLIQARLKPSNPSVVLTNSFFEDGINQFIPKKESLLDMHQADGIVFDNPFVWQADKAIFDLLMPETIPANYIPPSGTAVFSNIYKFTSSGTELKTVGEWIDSLCEVWENAVTNKVQIFTNPINNQFIEFHLARAFALEFTTANHNTLTDNTEYIATDIALSRRVADENWVKKQP